MSAGVDARTAGQVRAILVVHVPPNPPWTGERRRIAAAYAYLSGHYDCEIAVCRKSDSAISRLERKIRRPLAPPYAARFHPPDVDFDGYEIIWVYELWALSCVPARLWHRVVWDKDTVMSDGYRNARRLSRRVVGQWIWRYERHAAACVRHAFVSFAGDVARFGIAGVSALPHGYFPSAHTRPWSIARNRDGTRPRLGFVGLLSYKPNRLAVMRFATEILPSVRMEPELAALELWVAGAQLGADDAARLDALPGVVVLGYVPELAEFYAAIDLAIAPMDRGTGSPTKVIEALGHGVPVVGTARALRGLDENLRQWCVEASDSAWPAAVQAGLRLRTHPPPVDEVERCYSWSAVFERTVEPVLEVANG